MKEHSLVSVIVPTRNSAEKIEMCLTSIEQQTYKNIEVIIVDQESDDSTLKKCSRFNTKILSVPKSKFYTPPTISRNVGAKIAKGKYLLHIDSDMELTPRVVEECVMKCESEDFGAIIIHEIDVAEGYWGKCKALERSCYVGDSDLEGARFVRKAIFDTIGGYDESLSSGEDWDINQRYKNITKLSDIESFIKHHQGKSKLLKMIKKKYHYGSSLHNYIKKHPDMAKKQIVLIRPAYIRHWRRLACDPMHTAGFMFMKFCEFSAAGIGYIKNRR